MITTTTVFATLLIAGSAPSPLAEGLAEGLATGSAEHPAVPDTTSTVTEDVPHAEKLLQRGVPDRAMLITLVESARMEFGSLRIGYQLTELTDTSVPDERFGVLFVDGDRFATAWSIIDRRHDASRSDAESVSVRRGGFAFDGTTASHFVGERATSLLDGEAARRAAIAPASGFVFAAMSWYPALDGIVNLDVNSHGIHPSDLRAALATPRTSVRSQTASIDGTTCVVVDVRSDTTADAPIIRTLWLDPTRDWLPRRIENYPPGSTESDYTVQVVEFASFEGRTLPRTVRFSIAAAVGDPLLPDAIAYELTLVAFEDALEFVPHASSILAH